MNASPPLINANPAKPCCQTRFMSTLQEVDPGGPWRTLRLVPEGYCPGRRSAKKLPNGEGSERAARSNPGAARSNPGGARSDLQARRSPSLADPSTGRPGHATDGPEDATGGLQESNRQRQDSTAHAGDSTGGRRDASGHVQDSTCRRQDSSGRPLSPASDLQLASERERLPERVERHPLDVRLARAGDDRQANRVVHPLLVGGDEAP